MPTRTRAGALSRTLLLVLVAATALSACGRKGPLDRPGVEAAPAPEEDTITGGLSTTDEGTDAPPQAPQRRFILDPLID